MKDRHGNECKTVPVDGHFDMTKAALALLQSKNCGDLTVGDLGAAICNAIAAAPKFEAPEVDDAMALRISEKYHGIQFEAYFSIGLGRDMIAAVRTELGPTLGLVEIREPTPDECERISMAYYDDEALVDRDHRHLGKDMFAAVRAVMWPKSEVQS